MRTPLGQAFLFSRPANPDAILTPLQQAALESRRAA
jgi:hypothetical protein